MTTAYIGKPTSRVDGRAKVTGSGRYAAEYNVPDLAHGCIVSSAIARGTITSVDTRAARELPGVLRVFTHENSPGCDRPDEDYRDDVAPPGSPFRPLCGNRIQFSMQPVALVVAESFELARYAASLVSLEYEREPHATDLEAELANACDPVPRNGIPRPPGPRGKPDAAFAGAAVRIDAQYRAPDEHHNPMELFGTTVVREEDGRMTVYDKTQGVQNVQGYLCRVFGCSPDDLRVVSKFMGGGFGSGLRPGYQVYLAVMAARELKRSVRVSMTRQQMFTFTHRPATWQRVALGAARDGRLEAVIHEAIAETSRFEDYSETVVDWSGVIYSCENVRLSHRVAKLDLHTPGDMRAPGATWGMYALECAMDELAVEAGIDPVELRLRNYAERDGNEDKPFSSKELRTCYRQGAERFGWARRDPRPRSMRDGRDLIGWGMAGGIWEAFMMGAAAKAILTADGRLTVSSAASDIGTGTCTVMTQIGAETLGLPLEDVTFQHGDSSLPESPVEGGSWLASTIGTAVKAACEKVGQRLLHLARKIDNSPLGGIEPADVVFADRQIASRKDPSRRLAIEAIMRAGGGSAIEEDVRTGPSEVHEKYSRMAHSAIFAEVRVDEELGVIRVSRVVSAIAGGRILNPKTARSQLTGGIVMGIGMALEEESALDHDLGRFMNHNLAEYFVAVNPDVHDIEVIFIEEFDRIVNPLGSKGLGEIGVVGVAAAIANAVFHATGKRIRRLPITLDRLL